tara:strand:+ start:212 stop:457 length:246 start_codon:yes stop_codon:yes gene_type:complete
MVQLIFFLLLFLTTSFCFSNELTNQELLYFNFLDLNNDQLISFDEISKSTQLIMQLIDENNDNKISKDEIISLKMIIESIK